MARKIEGSPKFTDPKGHPKDRIILHPTEDMPKQGQYFGLNGYGFQIKPGEEVDIPRPLRQMIDNCITTKLIQENGEEYIKNYPRFPYTLVKEDVDSVDSSPEAIAARETKEATA